MNSLIQTPFASITITLVGLVTDKKIAAIKLIRTFGNITGGGNIGLRVAKNAADSLMEGSLELEIPVPAYFADDFRQVLREHGFVIAGESVKSYQHLEDLIYLSRPAPEPDFGHYPDEYLPEHDKYDEVPF